MSEYTPGPWEIDFTCSPYQIGHDGELIAEVATHADGVTCKADGLVMTAAPDLLEAAIELLERVKVEHGIYDLMNIDEEIEAMECAIAKAKGYDNAARS